MVGASGPRCRLLPWGLPGLARPSRRAAPLLPLNQFSIRGQRWHQPHVALALRSLPVLFCSKQGAFVSKVWLRRSRQDVRRHRSHGNQAVGRLYASRRAGLRAEYSRSGSRRLSDSSLPSPAPTERATWGVPGPAAGDWSCCVAGCSDCIWELPQRVRAVQAWTSLAHSLPGVSQTRTLVPDSP